MQPRHHPEEPGAGDQPSPQDVAGIVVVEGDHGAAESEGEAETGEERPTLPGARHDEDEGVGDREGCRRMTAGEQGRGDLAVAEGGLVARMREHGLEDLGRQVRPHDEDDGGNCVSGTSPVQGEQATAVSSRQLWQRVAEKGDELGHVTERRFPADR